MADLGFFRGRHVQLIQGEIVQMPAMKYPHAIAMGLGEDALRGAFGPGYWVRPQMPLDLGNYGEPEPDLAVVPGSPRDYTAHPTLALLLLEISDSSLRFDRKRKGAQYAFAGIADYWIVNLVDGRVEVYRDPHASKRNPKKSHYRSLCCFDRAGEIAPLALPHVAIKVADLLP